MNFVKAFLKHKQVILSVPAAGVCLWSELAPEYAAPRRSLYNHPWRPVIAYYPGAKAAQVEDQVTKKLEEYLSSLKR